MPLSEVLSRQLMKDFMKYELLDVAKELGLTDVNESITSKKMISMIYQDLEKNGVPDFADVSALCAEFLIAAEVCTDEGDIIIDDDQPESDTQVKKEDSKAEVEQIEKLPPCYGFEDDKDPSCRNCKVMAACRDTRMSNRPPCFGLMFDPNDDICRGCLEAPYCKIVSNKQKIQ